MDLTWQSEDCWRLEQDRKSKSGTVSLLETLQVKVVLSSECDLPHLGCENGFSFMKQWLY